MPAKVASQPAPSATPFSWHHPMFRKKPHHHHIQKQQDKDNCSSSATHSVKPIVAGMLSSSMKSAPSSMAAPPSSSAHSSPSSPHMSSPPPTPKPSPPSSPSTPNAMQAAYLDPQNTIRSKKGAPPLVWNNTLATFAQSWASKCQWKHSGGPNGENLAAGNGTFTAASGVNMWIGEESSYSSSNPQPSHYTQVVWKASTQLGCAEVTCENLFGPGSEAVHYHVCEYYPPGNVLGEFGANVEA